MLTLGIWSPPPADTSIGGVQTSATGLKLALEAHAPDRWRTIWLPTASWRLRRAMCDRDVRGIAALLGHPATMLALAAERRVSPATEALLEMVEGRAQSPADIVFAPSVFSTFTPMAREAFVVVAPNDFQHRRYPEFFSRSDLAKRELLFGRMMKRANLIVAGSVQTARDANRYYPETGDKTIVWRFPAPSDIREPSTVEAAIATRRLPASNRSVVFYPAQLWPHKNHATLIRALACMKGEERFCLALTGTGPNEDRLRRLAERLNVSGSVAFMGNLPRGEVFGLYHACSLVAVPSLFEQASYPLMEAGFFGRPILAANIPSLAEDLSNYPEALLPPEDHQAWARAIAGALTDTRLGERLADAGRAVHARHEIDRRSREFWDVVRSSSGIDRPHPSKEEVQPE